MIISEEIEKFDESTQVIMFDKDGNGGCSPKKSGLVLSSSSTFNLGEEYYNTRHKELLRLKSEVTDGKISILKLFIDYFLMDEKDVASRMQIPLKKLKKFLTPEGFKDIDVKKLIRFAGLFNVSVADFFQFIYTDSTSRLETKNLLDRTLQEIKVK
jgi:hypothetical protein